MAVDIIKQVDALSVVPSQKEAFDSWLQMQSAIAFLRDNLHSDDFVAYATSEFTFLHAVLVPRQAVKSPGKKDLLSWNLNASSSWSVWTTLTEIPSATITPPLTDTGSKLIDGGEQLVFARFFEGRLEDKYYYEASQKFVHCFGLHFMPERNAYCRLDERGDIEEVIRILHGEDDDASGRIITIKRAVIDQYAALNDSVILRMFDFRRFRPSDITGWSHTCAEEIVDKDLIYMQNIKPDYASYIRGVQIVEPQVTREQVARVLARGDEGERQYACFLAQDWKNHRICEISCDPKKTSNYFVESDLPFELSPAFFRPEVFAKYKADSEKYRIQERSITCRNAWHLKSYDINDAGQVHAYICDLRHLPYEEQLYWKAYNETPKAPISKRALAADFEGRWDFEYDPLVHVKSTLKEWERQHVPWWAVRNKELFDRVHYPVTSSVDEWANEILQLDQLLVEGFDEKWLRKTAESVGRNPDNRSRSLKMIQECLVGYGFELEHAEQIIAPLEELHILRSKLKGHASGNDAVKLKQKAIKDFRSYNRHFRNLCSDNDQSISAVGKAFEEHQAERDKGTEAVKEDGKGSHLN